MASKLIPTEYTSNADSAKRWLSATVFGRGDCRVSKPADIVDPVANVTCLRHGSPDARTRLFDKLRAGLVVFKVENLEHLGYASQRLRT